MHREVSMLREHGHEVIEYSRSNAELNQMSAGRRATAPFASIWSRRSRSTIAGIIEREKPDVAHFHNTQFMISQAAYYACREFGVPIVQTLHNPRFMCPAATLVYKGEPCERCCNRAVAWPGVLRACYRQSHVHTAVVAAATAFHRAIGSHELVSTYIASTAVYREKFISAGLPSERISVKPHFVTPDPRLRTNSVGEYAVFVGRLEKPKGVETVVDAWSNHLGDIPLVLRGTGPLRSLVKGKLVDSGKAVLMEQQMSQEDLFNLVKGARFLIWPSEGFYETFGLVVAEAFACGVPVIASDSGVANHMVTEGKTGLHFRAGDARDLASKVRWAWNEAEWLEAAGRAARLEFERQFTSEHNYRMLMDIYRETIQRYRN